MHHVQKVISMLLKQLNLKLEVRESMLQLKVQLRLKKRSKKNSKSWRNVILRDQAFGRFQPPPGAEPPETMAELEEKQAAERAALESLQADERKESADRIRQASSRFFVSCQAAVADEEPAAAAPAEVV